MIRGNNVAQSRPLEEQHREMRCTVPRSASSRLIRCLSCGRRARGSGGSSSPVWSIQLSNTGEREGEKERHLSPLVSQLPHRRIVPVPSNPDQKQIRHGLTIQLLLYEVHPVCELVLDGLNVIQQVQPPLLLLPALHCCHTGGGTAWVCVCVNVCGSVRVRLCARVRFRVCVRGIGFF